MDAVKTLEEISFRTHPPYQDQRLTGKLGDIYNSADGRFGAVYWIAHGPGRLLEQPQADELICILEGHAVVEWHDQRKEVGPGNVILWLVKDPPVVFVPDQLIAFCATYIQG